MVPNLIKYRPKAQEETEESDQDQKGNKKGKKEKVVGKKEKVVVEEDLTLNYAVGQEPLLTF